MGSHFNEDRRSAAEQIKYEERRTQRIVEAEKWRNEQKRINSNKNLNENVNIMTGKWIKGTVYYGSNLQTGMQEQRQQTATGNT